MLVHDFALVSAPCVHVTDRLRAEGRGLLAASVGAAVTESFGEFPFTLEVGSLLEGGSAYVLPFGLHTDQPRLTFQRLEGDLEYFALDPAHCQLRLLASYTPNGLAGPSRIEHARIEATMRAVLTHLARGVEASVGAVRSAHG